MLETIVIWIGGVCSFNSIIKPKFSEYSPTKLAWNDLRGTLFCKRALRVRLPWSLEKPLLLVQNETTPCGCPNVPQIHEAK